MSVTPVPSPYPAPGEIVGESWMVEKVLGEGGMGCVARAFHTVLHTPVALKFMNPQFMSFPGAVERFINEGKASGLIKSDHVVPVMDAKRLPNGTPYLVMECLEGHDLAELLARQGEPGLPVERAIHFVLQILRGLQAAHAIGIIHRDMKPSNCFVVNKEGEEDFIKILDFGISKVQQPGSASLTQTNSALGTPLYMSPEQARSPRDVDARSDLYSVGVILYELLVGHTPFFSENGEFTEILFKLFTAEPPPVQAERADLPDELAAVVHKALARETAQRYGSALEMATALAPFAAEHSKIIVERMRAFKAPAKGSIAPPEVLPPSMVAFSQLDRRTDVLVGRPETEVQNTSPVTELMDRAPGKPSPKTAILPPSPEPVTPSAIARHNVAVARTQLDTTGESRSKRPPAGASTDLVASRDAQVEPSSDAGTARRSPMVYAMPILAALVLAGGGIALVKAMKKDDGAGPAASASALHAETPPPSAHPEPPPSATNATANVASPDAATSTTSVASASGSTSSRREATQPPSRPSGRPNPTRDPGFAPGIIP